MSDADDLDDFIATEYAVSVPEEIDKAIVCKVRAEAYPEAASLNEDSDDDISPLAPIGSATANE